MIIEEHFEIGDIVFLRTDLFKTIPGNRMTEPGRQHMFVIVNTTPLTVCPISSKMANADQYKWSIPINNWQDAHLHKPSYVGVDNSGTITDVGIFKKIGALTPEDKSSIIQAYNEAPQRVKLESFFKKLKRSVE